MLKNHGVHSIQSISFAGALSAFPHSCCRNRFHIPSAPPSARIRCMSFPVWDIVFILSYFTFSDNPHFAAQLSKQFIFIPNSDGLFMSNGHYVSIFSKSSKNMPSMPLRPHCEYVFFLKPPHYKKSSALLSKKSGSFYFMILSARPAIAPVAAASLAAISPPTIT